MTDLTEQFQQTLSLLRNDRHLMSSIHRSQTKQSSEQVSRANIFRDIFSQIRSLFCTINQLRNILCQHRKDYINIYNPLEQNDNVLTDVERDEIDRTFETFQQNLPATLKQIQIQCLSNPKLPEQMRQHCLGVAQLTEKYAKRVCTSHNQMKQLRYQRNVEKQQISRLSFNLIGGSQQIRNRLHKRTDSENDCEFGVSGLNCSATTSTSGAHALESKGLLNNEHEQLLNSISSDELQSFQQENEQLYDDLNALHEEVKNIEGQVVKIAQLQEIFTENVLQQEQELNRVNMTIIGSTENIKGGNQHLREAMKKNADFRVWILFFIITLGFVILFLDWYNP